MTQRRGYGFTLVEVLVVIAIISILAGILFVVEGRAMESARSVNCLSNEKQLGAGMFLYANDADDQLPGASPYMLSSGRSFPTGMGWAGKIYPYVKQNAVFGCNDDSSQPVPGMTLTGSSKVSFAANDNLAPKTSGSTGFSKTVLLFEVAHSFALVDHVDEGMIPRPKQPEKVSAAGNGVKGVLLDSYIVAGLREPDKDVAYATGRLSNSDNDILSDDFLDDARHRNGANYLLGDGHSGFALPDAVSAGSDAHGATDPQSPKGCFILPATHGTDAPCAEGTSASGHKFTFSSV